MVGVQYGYGLSDVLRRIYMSWAFTSNSATLTKFSHTGL